MTMAITIYNPFDIVEIPFPFSALSRGRQRKAVVLSTREFHEKTGMLILMMLVRTTGEKKEFDIPILNWMASGLRNPCSARVKIITLELPFVQSYVGKIVDRDRAAIQESLKRATGVA